MKYIYLFVFLLTTNLISAQDLRLFENTWYLTKIVENGMDNFPPTASLPLTFNQQDSYLLTNGGCNDLLGYLTFGNNTTNFMLNSYSTTLALCDLPPFEPQYFSVFASLVPNNFSYTISENGTVKTLAITNLTNNKQAVYSNQNLSTVDFTDLNFSVYSETSTDLIIVELKNQNAEKTKVEVFDSLGKICKSNYFNSSQIKISTADLCSGVHIVKVTTDNEVGIRKFIKS